MRGIAVVAEDKPLRGRTAIDRARGVTSYRVPSKTGSELEPGVCSAERVHVQSSAVKTTGWLTD